MEHSTFGRSARDQTRPLAFFIMINELTVSNASIWKYVDDTTTSEVIKKGQHSEAQGIVNEVVNWSIRNRVKLNTDKCKELRISFTSDCDFPPVVIGEECIKLVKDAKLLGVTISGDLTWNAHITEVTIGRQLRGSIFLFS